MGSVKISMKLWRTRSEQFLVLSVWSCAPRGKNQITAAEQNPGKSENQVFNPFFFSQTIQRS